MSGTCSTEKCWLKQKFMKNKMGKELLKYTFAPSDQQHGNQIHENGLIVWI